MSGRAQKLHCPHLTGFLLIAVAAMAGQTRDDDPSFLARSRDAFRFALSGLPTCPPPIETCPRANPPGNERNDWIDSRTTILILCFSNSSRYRFAFSLDSTGKWTGVPAGIALQSATNAVFSGPVNGRLGTEPNDEKRNHGISSPFSTRCLRSLASCIQVTKNPCSSRYSPDFATEGFRRSIPTA